MGKVAGFFSSARLMAVLMAVFAVSIAAATFIENDFGSPVARSLVYNARWFEILLLLGAINLLTRIVVKKLHKKDKFPIFLFHAAFLVILTGSAITRYTGSEGTLSIREGDTTNLFLTDQTYLTIRSENFYRTLRVKSGPFGRIRLNKTIETDQESLKIRAFAFVPNAYETIVFDEGGTPVAEFIVADSTGRRNLVIARGEKQRAGSLTLEFDSLSADSMVVRIFATADSLGFIAGFPVTVSNMGATDPSVLAPHRKHTFLPQQIYTFNGQMLLLNNYISRGKITARPLQQEGETYDALIVEVSGNNFKKEVVLLGKSGYPGLRKTIATVRDNLIISYGSVYKELPFELKLNDFIIERYPGSRSPSSFESRVSLVDAKRNYSDDYRIYMNNILKYKGYRLYQSSYDPDEKGTILSVNHDLAGTSVTYAGYFLLGAGMLLSLFNAGSRFRYLSADSKRLKSLKNSLLILLFIVFGTEAFTQEAERLLPVDADHAAHFGRLLVQDNSGRIEPVNTLSSEVLRKLIRKNTYKGMNSDQVFLGMMTNPSAWQYEPIIRVTHPQILELMRTKEKYHSFADFFTGNQYILQDYVSGAYRKKPALRTKFDNEIIKLDERINISYMAFSGEFLKIFPVPGDSTHTWYSHEGVKGRVLTGDSVFTGNIMYLYAQEVFKGMQTGNWAPSNKVLSSISQWQGKFSADIIPSPRKVSAEIFLNRADLFSRISKFYGIIGFILLILQFTALFFPRLKLKLPVIIALSIIILIFSIHTAGLGLRWYVSGHAPWSNGYEALTYVAWATILAGLIFSVKSSLTLSVTSILAFLILFVAHLSWMDPQITNLVPVLKSYWLVIHVATITASYGFLAMGALLGFTNLLMMFLHKSTNRLYIKFTILEITNTIEMALTIGLYLLTLGVFLGAVWANESWGRYWGWDPKETWALVTVIVYAFILHMRMVPGLKGAYAINLASLVGFFSVIMTYFGVNYYLSGLHSYAQGDPLPVPVFVYYTLIVIIITSVAAWTRSRKLELDT